MQNNDIKLMGFITVKELAKKIPLSDWTIRDLIRKGVLPAYKVSERIYLLDYDEVVKAIKKNKLSGYFNDSAV